MKQKGLAILLAILLAIYLMFVHVGFGYAFHFCHDQLQTISSTFETNAINNDCCEESESCCASTSNTHDDCCNDIIVTSDLDDNILPIFNFNCAFIGFPTKFKTCLVHDLKLETKKEKISLNPPAHAPPLYELYSQRIFYC